MYESNVVLYTKPGCSLCEKAGRVVERVLADIPFALEVVDITTSSELLQRYGLYIPVISIDGVEFSRYHVNESKLRALLTGERTQGTLRG
ncbi:MAG: glutaredoxin family protein [Prosthecochloris sp.]|nr:glutaredoxin family protein [Prosthecochloris sp.]